MDWTTQLQLLHMMQGSFPGPNFLELPSQRVPEGQVRALLEQTELGQREEVDAAVRAFSRSGKWPENLSQSEKYFLTQRLEFAVWLTLALVAPDGAGRYSRAESPARVRQGRAGGVATHLGVAIARGKTLAGENRS